MKTVRTSLLIAFGLMISMAAIAESQPDPQPPAPPLGTPPTPNAEPPAPPVESPAVPRPAPPSPPEIAPPGPSDTPPARSEGLNNTVPDRNPSDRHSHEGQPPAAPGPHPAPQRLPEREREAQPTSPPASVSVRQAISGNDGISVYLDVRDERGHLVPIRDKNNFKFEVGPYGLDLKGMSEGEEERSKGLATIFLVDVSMSLSESSFANVRKALRTWVQQMRPEDRVAIVAFGESVTTSLDFTNSTTDATDSIDRLKPTDKKTRLNDAVLRALDLGQRRDNDLPRRRVVVLLSDGLDDAADGATAQEVQGKIESSPLPVYTVGFSVGLNRHTREQGLRTLGGFSRNSGGELFEAEGGVFDATYEKIFKRIFEAKHFSLLCSDCPSDGRLYPLQVSYQDQNRVITGEGHIRMALGAKAHDESQRLDEAAEASWFVKRLPQDLKPYWKWILFVAIAVLILLPATYLVRRARYPSSSNLSDFKDVQDDPLEALNEFSSQTYRAPDPVIQDSSGIQLRLTVVKGNKPGLSWGFILHDKTLIGRSSASDIQIPDDPEISGKHFVLSREGEAVFLKDAGSTNGTMVNGVYTKTAFRLQEGDQITAGRTVLRLTRA